MKKFTKGLFLTATAFSLLSQNTNAATFTAVASGNFSSAATWGGSAPASMISSDVVIIPSGIDVALTSDVSFSGTSSLTVLGTLKSATSGTALIMTSGSLSGSGSIDVDSLALGLTSGITYLGSITANKMTSIGASISTAANVTVRESLHLSSGILNFTSGNLNLGSGSTILITSGTLSTGGSSVINMDSTYNVVYKLSSTNTGPELNGSGLDSVTIDATAAVTLSSNLMINGTLVLKSGHFDLNSNTLTFASTGKLAAMGSGTISANGMSNIIVNSASGLGGSLSFTAGSNMLNNFTINTGSASAMVHLGTNVQVDNNLTLSSGSINLGSNNLKLKTGAMISGGSSNSYVVADGTGVLTINLAASSSDTFKIGTSTDYTPIVVKANSSSVSSDVSVNVTNTVMANGTTGTVLTTTQPMVKNTWFVSSSATSGINFDLTAMWSSSLEVNSFNRAQAYLSHYTSGSWDLTASSSAVSVGASMYAMTRAGITSLSPFMVADKDAATTTIKNISATERNIQIFPNPASNTLYYNLGANKIDQVNIYNQLGRLVKSEIYKGNTQVAISDLTPGNFIIQFVGKDFSASAQFIKQ